MDAWKRIKIVLIRHGESRNNIIYETIRQKFGDTLSPERFEEEIDKLHDPDCGLSPDGILQAAKLNEYFARGGLSNVIKNPDEWRIFSSPMRRCLLTCAQVSAGLGNKSVSVVPFLHESDGCYKTEASGETTGLPGLTAVEVEQEFANFKCEEGMTNGWFHLQKKETRAEFYSRSVKVVRWLWDMLAMTPEKRGFEKGVVIVAHGNLIGAIISELMKSRALFTFDNTGMTLVELWSDRPDREVPSVVFSNRVDHLLGEPHLIKGSATYDDHWIQEYVNP